jgi:hypothetical protein
MQRCRNAAALETQPDKTTRSRTSASIGSAVPTIKLLPVVAAAREAMLMPAPAALLMTVFDAVNAPALHSAHRLTHLRVISAGDGGFEAISAR